MTQIPSFESRGRSASPDQDAGGSSADSQAFRDALAQQSINQLSAILDAGATASVPGAGVAIAQTAVNPPADAASLASAELVRQDLQLGIRDRGLDAASASQQELRSRTPNAPGSYRGLAAQDADRPSGGPSPLPAGERQPPDRQASQGSAESLATTTTHGGRSQSGGAHATQQHGAPEPTLVKLDAARSSIKATALVSTGSNVARPVSTARGAESLRAASALPKQAASAAQAISGDRSPARTDRIVPAKPAVAAHRPDAAAQVQRGLAQVLRQGGGSVTLKLTPNDLGVVTVALRLQQGRMTGTIDTQTAAARDLLKADIDALKASLEQRGVTVDRLDVRLQGAAESDSHARSGAEPRNEPAGTHADTGGERHSGSTGGEDRRSAKRDGVLTKPEQGDSRGTASLVRDDGQGRPDEPDGTWLRLDTTA
ncbi:MAG: flagellar hook-length control protein FliK [Planctomycetota bacterium]